MWSLRFLSTCFFSFASFAQQSAAPHVVPGLTEFPVVMQQNIEAGKTPAGAKVQAKLAVATMVSGVVIPANAVLSGEVLESKAKNAGDPSRLSVRMSSATWKGGSAAIKIYVTGWYYPTINQAGQDLQYGPEQPASRSWNGEGQYPSEKSKVYRPFPGDNSDKNSSAPDTTSSVTSSRRIPMKDVEFLLGDDGAIVLLGKRANLKLDKSTTYVLAAIDSTTSTAK